MPVDIINDERGAISTYFMGVYAIGIILIFAFLLTTAAAVRQHADAAYGWFVAASNYAVYTATMSGIGTADDDNTSQVRGYFDTAFSGITQTTVDGNEYDPQAGSLFPRPITLNRFAPESQGAALPNGRSATSDGYWISVTVPIVTGNIPFLGPETVDIPMSYYAAL